jgi:tRNA A37 methylthiotransferase MiaB
MPMQVDGNIAKQRLKELEAKIAQKNLLFRQKQSILEVLVESKKDNIFKGYDQFFNPIEITSDTDLIGNWVQLENYTVEQNINKAVF